MRKKLLIVLGGLFLCGFTAEQGSPSLTQPLAERRAQDKLPKSTDPMWDVLGKTKIHLNEKKGLYSATFPPEVKALVGKQVTIVGFMLPLEATEKFHHFILSKRTPTCPFCPPGEPNEIVDVWVDTPIAWNEDIVRVTGTFELMNNPELGLFFKLAKAQRK
jgi:hypothetical protein